MRLVYNCHDQDDTQIVVRGQKFTVRNNKGFKYSAVTPLVLPDISLHQYVHDDTSWAQDLAPVSVWFDRMVGPGKKLLPNTNHACLTDDQSRCMKNFAKQIVEGISPDKAIEEYNAQMAALASETPTHATTLPPTDPITEVDRAPIYILLLILIIIAVAIIYTIFMETPVTVIYQ